MASAGRAKRRCSPSTLIVPVDAALQAEKRARKLGLAGAHQPEDAENLAFAEREGDAAQRAARRQILDLQHRLADVDRRLRELLRQTPPDHHADQRRLVGLARRQRADDPAVAEHRDAVGDERHLGRGGARCR